MTAKQGSLSPRTIWGKVVLYLKANKQVALHVACGDITDVAIQDGKFIVNLFDGMLANLLNEGKKEIERALSWQGLDLKLQINCKQEVLSTTDHDLKRLKEVFGEVKITHTKLLW